MRSLEALTEIVLEIVREQLRPLPVEFDASSDLVASGLDSLAVTQVLLAIEERTGIWVDEGLLTPENLASVETLAACVHGLQAAA